MNRNHTNRPVTKENVAANLLAAAAAWAELAEQCRLADMPDNGRKGKIRRFQNMAVVKLQEAANA